MANEKYSFQRKHDITSSGKKTDKITLKTAGTYVDRNIEVETEVNVPESTVTVNGKNVTATAGFLNDGLNINVQSGSLNNEATSGVTYTKDTSAKTVIPAGGSLYINEGYYPNTEITLGQMIPDDTNLSNAGNGHILKDYEAYDTNGNKLVGTIPTITPTFTGGAVTATASASIPTPPVVTVTGSGSLLSATSYGVTTTKPTGTDGTNYLTVDGGGEVTTTGTARATANASSEKVTYSTATTGYVNKSSGTQALEGKQATQKTDDTSITPTVIDSFPAKYIPITSVSFSGGTVTATADGEVKTTPSATASVSGSATRISGLTSTSKPTGTDGTDYITIAPSITSSDGIVNAKADAETTKVTYTNSAGAIVAHDGTTAVDKKTAVQKTKSITVTPDTFTGSTYYMSKSTIGSTASVTKAPSVTVSGSATGFTASTSATSYYVTVSGSANNGTATSYKTATAGFTPEVTSTSGGTATITPSVSGSGGKVYIPTNTLTPTVTQHNITNPKATAGVEFGFSTNFRDYELEIPDFARTEPTDNSAFLVFSPTISSEQGKSSVKGQVTTSNSAGIVPASTTYTASSASEKSIAVTTTANTATNYYIPVYTGAYTTA